MTGAARTAGAYRVALAVVLVAGLLHRLAYVLAQPAADPAFARPILDGAIYMDWARALASGSAGPGGAFYLAPLYPYVLGLFLRVAGESFTTLYLLQQLLSVTTAGWIGWQGRAVVGPAGAVAAAGLFLMYPPILFFASVPLGETLSLFLLVVAALTFLRGTPSSALAGGVALGLAVLARPNLLLVGLAWGAGAALLRDWRRTSLVLAGVFLVVLPVTVRNLAVSGHLVPVSSNAGLTAYHGNGPGAQGIFTPPRGLSGRVTRQREEAAALARSRSGLPLDAVEADRWWGRQALATRLADPVGTIRLLSWRALLVLDSYEHGLDYAPMMDANPWRASVRVRPGPGWALVPLGLLIGLSSVGLLVCGARGSGGWETWSALVACAATPVLFYVSSRYRLPAAALLTLPAGAGLGALLTDRGLAAARRAALVALALAIAVVSLLVPSRSLQVQTWAGGLSNRAMSHRWAGDLESAERDARASIAIEEREARFWHNLAVILEQRGKNEEAEASYRSALALDPAFAEAAANLASLLGRRGAPVEAIAMLRRTLTERPEHAACWNNLIVSYLLAGDVRSARQAITEARSLGIALDSGLVRQVESTGARQGGEP